MIGSVRFAEGETTKTITIDITGDEQLELDETFTLNLVDAALSGNTASATGTIINDDGVPTISVENQSVTEGNSGTKTMTFTVNRTGDAQEDQTFNYSFAGVSADGDDVSAFPTGRVLFAEGETTKTITIDITGDEQLELDATFTLNLVDEGVLG